MNASIQSILCSLFVMSCCLTGVHAQVAQSAQTAQTTQTTQAVQVKLLQSDSIASITQKLKQLYPATQFKSIEPTPMKGVYQVVMGQNVAYVDETGRYFMFGHVFDMATQTDLTENVLTEVSRVKFDELISKSGNQVLRFGNQNAKPSLIVFSDPNCGFCKQFERELKTLVEKRADLSVWVMMYPVLGQDSMDKTVSIWCAKDKENVWRQWMLGTSVKAKEPAYQTCENPIMSNLQVGKSLNISGTPSLILPNGTVLSGYKTATELEGYLTEIATQAKLARQ
jgi:thiol:disulfide interchange protein DsbC